MSVLRLKVDFTQVTIEELEQLKMDLGWEKYGDPTDTDFTDMFMRFLRYFGEYLTAAHMRDHIGMMEALADIKNGCNLLYPHIQEAYIKYREVEEANPRHRVGDHNLDPYGDGDSNRFK